MELLALFLVMVRYIGAFSLFDLISIYQSNSLESKYFFIPKPSISSFSRAIVDRFSKLFVIDLLQNKVSVGNVKIQRSMEKRSLMKKLTPMKKLSTIKKKLNPMKNLRNVKRIKRCIKFIKIKIQQKEKP
ncbi:unnamed protein product [Lactuca saligna]|uniref:Uncharacterized protein n=1 Tax=Lactuca saligna TaxID=75948 RepID=A0AA35VMB6_LACSI|nr:unnamed protein product [Lactuca saligna]